MKPHHARSVPSAPSAAPTDARHAPPTPASAAMPGGERYARASDLEASASTLDLQTTAIPPDRTAASGRYLLTGFHARGGMGEVWRCHDSVIGREVALKRLVSERPAARERFLCEAQVTGQLEHPGIVSVHDLGFDGDGKPYYVMSLVRGRTLKEEIAAFHCKPRPADAPPVEVQRLRLLKIFLDLCNAVAYAHSRGVIHRDIKPDNVMLGAYGETVVLDWGLAKLGGQLDLCGGGSSGGAAGSGGGDAVSGRSGSAAAPPVQPTLSSQSAPTQDGSILGSPPYMPPEMARGRAADTDHRTDVYLLGATLYEILAGRPPREGGSRDEMLELARSSSPAAPCRVAGGVPKALEAVCLKAMSTSRDHRYDSALSLAEDVQRFIAGEPVSAYPEPWAARAWRSAKRHRRALARAAVAALLIAVSLVAVSLHREVARSRERDLARAEVRRVLRLIDEARFYAASVDQPGEVTPYYDPARARSAAREAMAAVEPWGAALERLPLEPEGQALRRGLSEMLLAEADAGLNVPGAAAATEAIALIDRAETMRGGTKSRGSLLLRARSLRMTGRDIEADRLEQLAEAPGTQRQAHDLFLEGEQARLASAAAQPFPGTNARRKRERTAALSRAAERYQAALRTDPSDYWARFQLGRCYLATGRAAEATEAIGACIALRPDVPWGYAARGLSLALQRRFDEASADFDRALELDPHNFPAQLNRVVMFRLQSRPAAAVAALDALLANPGAPSEAAIYRAQLFITAGDANGALGCLAGVASAAPQQWIVASLRAQARFLAGEDDKALRELDAVVFSKADPLAAAAVRGRLLRFVAAELPAKRRKAALSLAAENLSRAAASTAETPDAAVVMADLGAVLQLQGHADGAVEAFTRAAAIDRGDPQLLVNRGWANETRDRLDAAAADFAAALAIDEQHAEALSGLAYVDARRGRVSDAQRRAALALLHGGQDYLILHNVACVYAKLAATAQPGTVAASQEEAAFDLLSRAVSAWHTAMNGPNELELIESEVAFPPSMRARPEFKRLLTQSGGA